MNNKYNISIVSIINKINVYCVLQKKLSNVPLKILNTQIKIDTTITANNNIFLFIIITLLSYLFDKFNPSNCQLLMPVHHYQEFHNLSFVI